VLSESSWGRPAYTVTGWQVASLARTKDLQHDANQLHGGCVVLLAEEVCPLNRRQRPATTKIQIGDRAVIEPDRDQPRSTRLAQPQLIDRYHQFLILVTLLSGQAVTGETDDKH
jgi:hypothetical protein